MTTFSIVIHELPHEITDFAILLRADFNRWSAVQAQVSFKYFENNLEFFKRVMCDESMKKTHLQLLTAIGGALGAWAALFLHTECATSGTSQNILPFTAGGFINIALTQILPELMKETDSRYYNSPLK